MAFEDLEVWKRSAGLSADVYSTLKNLNDYGYQDQITRSGLSIPSNIAEGIERCSDRETLNFLSYAKGSCGELRTQVYIGVKIGYLPPNKGKQWVAETKEISAMIVGLMNSIKLKLD